MIEFPRIGEGNEFELRENMVDLDAPARDHRGRRRCLYMQDTWRVTPEGGVPYSRVPIRIFRPGEELGG